MFSCGHDGAGFGATNEGTRNTAGMDEFFPAAEGLYHCVADLFRNHEAGPALRGTHLPLDEASTEKS